MFKTCKGLLLLVCLLGSCHNEDFDIGTYLSEMSTRAALVDTLSVKLSIIAVDSVITSNRGVAFVGTYADPLIGETASKSFMEFKRTTSTESNKDARFDSIVLVLTPNGDYYGDTLFLSPMKVSKLAVPIELDRDGALYSTSSSVQVGDQVFDGMVSVNIGAKREFEVRLPDELGKTLFYGIINEETPFDASNFVKTFPGLALETGTKATSASIYGYSVTDSTCAIRIYYHVSDAHREEKIMTFLVNPQKQFNQYTTQRLPDLQITSNNDPKPSSSTRHMGFVQSGTPLYTRLDLPNLNDFLDIGEIVYIQRAVLIIRPVHGSYETVPLPPTLYLYAYDPTNNTPYSPLTRTTDRGAAEILTGNLPTNYKDIANPYYSFDITSFVSSQMGAVGYGKWALSVLIPDDKQGTTMQRLVFGDQQYWYKSEAQSRDNRVQLQVIYNVYNEY